MTAYTSAPRLASYRAVAAHGGVAAADPHGLILMLMNGAFERISAARGCIQNKSYAEKARLIHRSVSIVDELRGCLDLKSGGELAGNLHELYDYMCRQLLRATVENNVELLDEVTRLLHEVRDAWIKMPKNARPGAPAQR